MAKGAEAKSKVVEVIKNAFGDKFLGELNGKYYIESSEGGEKVQVAINLTCPKVLFEMGEVAPADSAFGVAPTSAFGPGSVAPTQPKVDPAAITEQEKENIKNLLQNLGL